MFCSHCGAKIEAGFKYCPVCGATQDEPQPASPAQDPIYKEQDPIKPLPKKAMPLWFKILIGLALLALIGVTAGILFTESLVDIVDKQLETLHKGDIQKAYSKYTSQDFQSATSLKEFEDFVHSYPIFTNNQSATFTERSMDNHIGTLKGKLTAPDHTATPIEYKLVKENGKWKILSIRLLKPYRLDSQSKASTNEFIQVVKSQLQALENNQIDSAYEKYSSKEFKEAISLEDFNNFVRKYPIITNHDSVSLHKPLLKKEIGTLAVILHNGDTAAYLKYYLIFEDDRWKIWSMRILSPTEGEEDEKREAAKLQEPANLQLVAPMQFTSVKLSDDVDEKDIIKTAKSQFTAHTADIYANIEITNGIKGETVTLTLQHMESKKAISPVQATIENDGESLLISVFSPPAAGWPVGHYQLLVVSSTGLEKTLDFEIK